MSTRPPDQTTDAAGRLWWALRKYALLVAVIVGFTMGSVATVFVPFDEGTDIYRAEALVIATELAARVDELPKSAQAIFDGGGVAERAVAEGGLPYAAEDLIPTSADVEPIDGTPLVRVIGLDADPQLAARIANAAALALAEELSAPGPGFGVFAVQELARVPLQPEPTSSLPTPLLTGLIAGVSLATGIVALLMITRQPVVTSTQARDLVGIPEIGHLSVRNSFGEARVDQVVGLGLLVRSLYPNDPNGHGRTGTVVFIGCGRRRIYTKTLRLIEQALKKLGPARTVHLTPEWAKSTRQQDGDAASGPATVVVGPSTGSSDIVQYLPEGVRTVLLVKEGVSKAQLVEAVSQLPADELLGFVFIVSQTRLATLPQPLVTAPAPSSPSESPVPQREASTPTPPGTPVITDLRGGVPVSVPVAEDAVAQADAADEGTPPGGNGSSTGKEDEAVPKARRKTTTTRKKPATTTRKKPPTTTRKKPPST